ncbi:MAG: Glu-tRNA(Gln) amidotransferase GatDE subunit D, partial [Candidatus Aenigmatarchaeota archaeon]
EFNPELGEIANIDGRELFQLLSENMTPEHWQKIAREVEKEIRKGVDGIVIMHGTDTMGYTAAALSFMLEDLPVPVVLVGSQRSSDRGSSDSHMNLACAVKAATSDIAEVMVCMHGESSDTYCYLHRGTKARKMHTSARYAFRTVNTEPIAKVHWEGLRIEILSDYRRKDKSRKLKLLDRMEKRVSLVKIYPGMNMELLKEVCKRSKGIIIEGTGLGHVPVNAIKILKRFISEGGYVFMTSQCLYGRVNMNVYETGRDLLQIGVMGNYTDMLPETALVKMMWVLGNHKKNVKEMMERNLRGEITDRSVF